MWLNRIGLGKQQGALVTRRRKWIARRQGGHRGRRHHHPVSMASRLTKLADLPRMVGNTKPGTKSTVTVFRRGAVQGFVHRDCRGGARQRRCGENRLTENKAKFQVRRLQLLQQLGAQRSLT
jgi:hypothetical protein